MAKRRVGLNRERHDAADGARIDAEPAKLQLALQLIEAIEACGRTQAATAAVLGIDQPKVSRLLRGQVAEFSASRLLHFLTLLGQDVEIVIHATNGGASMKPGHLRIVANRQTST